MNKQLKGDLLLVLVTLCWGISYYLMDISLTDMGPFLLNAYRFTGAFVVAGILMFKRLKTINKETFLFSVLAGLILVVVYMGATFGVKYTSLSKSGFLCALTVIFIPIFEMLIFRKMQEKKTYFAIAVSFIGIMLLTLQDDFSVNMAELKGDLLCLMCAAAYGIHIMVIEKAVNNEKVDAFHLGVFQLLTTGLAMLILSFIFETPHIPKDPVIIGSVAFLSVFSTGVAFIVQAIAQQYTKASHVGLIFTLEPVFAGFAAYFLAGDVLSVRAYFGAILMIAALIITEIDFKKT